MKKKFYFTMILSMALCVACQNENENNEPTPLPDAKPVAVHIRQKITTDNAFAFDIFKATCADSKDANIFISPLSISMAFNMVLNGAKGATSDEILETLRAKDYTVSDINEHSRLLRSELTGVDPSTQLSIANSIWYRQDLPVKNAFLEVNRTNYAAEVSALDFSSPDAIKQINNWCARQTGDKIKSIVDNISSETAMWLINAVYFKGIWTSKFDKNNTRKEDFYTSDGKTNQVQMMRQTASFKYGADEYGEYLELPYGNQAFSMILLLPGEDRTAEDMVERLNSDRWNRTVESMSGREVNLSLPRFKVECKYEMHENILPELGMRIPFTRYADFGNISEVALFISQVIHKTFIEVNEEGTEAAAVTGISMGFTSAGPSQTIDFIVNKPFVFAISEKSSGVILFMGKIGEID
ncbi:MAG: serpin family protein [Prevotellaceae bacterium]|jgi:serpin B|nr:serpin family protein [Prevotellaceae bacterium]